MNSKISAFIFEENELNQNKEERYEEAKGYTSLSPESISLMHRRTRSHTTNSRKSFRWDKNNIYKCNCLLQLVRVVNLNLGDTQLYDRIRYL